MYSQRAVGTVFRVQFALFAYVAVRVSTVQYVISEIYHRCAHQYYCVTGTVCTYDYTCVGLSRKDLTFISATASLPTEACRHIQYTVIEAHT